MLVVAYDMLSGLAIFITDYSIVFSKTKKYVDRHEKEYRTNNFLGHINLR